MENNLFFVVCFCWCFGNIIQTKSNYNIGDKQWIKLSDNNHCIAIIKYRINDNEFIIRPFGKSQMREIKISKNQIINKPKSMTMNELRQFMSSIKMEIYDSIKLNQRNDEKELYENAFVVYKQDIFGRIKNKNLTSSTYDIEICDECNSWYRGTKTLTQIARNQVQISNEYELKYSMHKNRNMKGSEIPKFESNNKDEMEVYDFLDDIGDLYIDQFLINGINKMKFMLLLNESDLKEMNVKLGHRKWITQQIQTFDPERFKIMTQEKQRKREKIKYQQMMEQKRMKSEQEQQQQPQQRFEEEKTSHSQTKPKPPHLNQRMIPPHLRQQIEPQSITQIQPSSQRMIPPHVRQQQQQRQHQNEQMPIISPNPNNNDEKSNHISPVSRRSYISYPSSPESESSNSENDSDELLLGTQTKGGDNGNNKDDNENDEDMASNFNMTTNDLNVDETEQEHDDEKKPKKDDDDDDDDDDESSASISSTFITPQNPDDKIDINKINKPNISEMERQETMNAEDEIENMLNNNDEQKEIEHQNEFVASDLTELNRHKSQSETSNDNDEPKDYDKKQEETDNDQHDSDQPEFEKQSSKCQTI